MQKKFVLAFPRGNVSYYSPILRTKNGQKTDKNGHYRTKTDKNGHCASRMYYLCIVIPKNTQNMKREDERAILSFKQGNQVISKIHFHLILFS